MKNKRTPTPKMTVKWSDADRQAFADRNILRAQRMPNARAVASKQACKNRNAWA